MILECLMIQKDGYYRIWGGRGVIFRNQYFSRIGRADNNVPYLENNIV